MNFFNRTLDDLFERLARAQYWTTSASQVKKYRHAVEQKQFLVDFERAWWCGFFASSIQEVEEKMKKVEKKVV